MGPVRKRAPAWARWLAVYLLLLAVSWVVRGYREPGPEAPGTLFVELAAFEGDRPVERRIRVAYDDLGPNRPGVPTVILLHGSPGSRRDFATVAPVLAERYRVVIPDLPGFGDSTDAVADYSIRAHAHYVAGLMDVLDLDRAHVVGFSMGGGVALNLWDLRRDRVQSVTLLAGIGVQELELLGEYRINHLIHGAQLGALWLVHQGVPHMGWLDDSMLDLPYARNFFDSDQRPLRGILERLEPPMLVIHGERDFLVPPAAALEHHRLVPQSRLRMVEGDHFMVFTRGPEVASWVESFIGEVEDGERPSRVDTGPAARRRAAMPFDPGSLPPATGMALGVLFLVIVIGTLISEDLTCIVVGLMISQGRIEFAPGVVACIVGIYVGDLMLFAAGRLLGRPILKRAPLRWWLTEDRVERASRWFATRGARVIFLSRFVPGARLPTYFAAGMLRTNAWAFSAYFLVAVVVWTPLLVGGAMAIGERAIDRFEWVRDHSFLALIVVALGLTLLLKLALPACTHAGRRRIFGRACGIVRWEFWPAWLFYLPVAGCVVALALRHRSPLLFTAANPVMPAGGVIGESKFEILEGLGPSPQIARFRLLSRNAGARRVEEALGFMQESRIEFPVVLKPDAGQRGSGVAIVRDRARMERYLETSTVDTLIQEFVPGPEFGIFYYRLPGEPIGRIFSITEKRLPVVIGDGKRTLERLILDDRRAVCMASFYLRHLGEAASRVPQSGERVTLVELGTHCRGAIFLDGSDRLTEPLASSIDALSRGYDGFFFGRYDVRVHDTESFPAGSGFKVVELNGVTSEATHIYDPRISLFTAYTVLFRQWGLAYEIGRRNRENGARPASFAELVRAVGDYRRQAAGHDRSARA